MIPLFKVAISPKDGKRYNNTENINGVDFILNTHIDEKDFKYSQRVGIVEKLPYHGDTGLQVGDEVIVHHNVFRRYWGHDVTLRDGDAFFSKDEYICGPDQIYAYKRDGDWICLGDYCFVEPIKDSDDIFISDEFKERQGRLLYSNEQLTNLGYNIGDIVGFSPYSEYEFKVDGKLMYKMSTKDLVGLISSPNTI